MNQPRTLKAWEIRAILRACEMDSRWFGARDKALIALGALTGARAAALVSLNLGNLRGPDGGLRTDFVVGREFIKRKLRSEEFAIPDALRLLLLVVLEDGGVHWRGSGPRAVFVSRRGLRLRREDVTRRLKARAREAGVDPTHVSAHSLRHFAGEFSDTSECRAEGVASGALPDGIESIEVSRLFLGHRSTASTRHYLRSSLKRTVRRHVSGMLAKMLLGGGEEGTDRVESARK